MWQREQLMEEVTQVLRGPCGVAGEISETSLLGEDLQLDSMGLLALAMSLENRFKVRLDEDPSTPPQSVAALLDLLERNLRKS